MTDFQLIFTDYFIYKTVKDHLYNQTNIHDVASPLTILPTTF